MLVGHDVGLEDINHDVGVVVWKGFSNPDQPVKWCAVGYTNLSRICV